MKRRAYTQALLHSINNFAPAAVSNRPHVVFWDKTLPQTKPTTVPYAPLWLYRALRRWIDLVDSFCWVLFKLFHMFDFSEEP